MIFCGERRRSKVSETCRIRRGEGYGACGDEGEHLSDNRRTL